MTRSFICHLAAQGSANFLSNLPGGSQTKEKLGERKRSGGFRAGAKNKNRYREKQSEGITWS